MQDSGAVSFPLIKTDDIVLYEIFVRNFSPEGTLKAIIPQLDRLKDLGVNVLWLMPIQPTGKVNRKGTYGSPYSISNFTEIHPDYGSKADFKMLIDSVHAKGMYIIIDEVANHTAWDISWIKDHPEWYNKDSSGNIIWPAGTDWNDVADLDYRERGLVEEKIKCLWYWVEEFDIDGYRCDMASMVPGEFWKEAIDSLRKIKPILMLAESDDPKMYELGFDMTYGWEMYHKLVAVWNRKETVASVDSLLQKEKARYPAHYRHIRFVTNHDENSWDDVPQVKFVNEDGLKAAFVTMLSLPGVPLLYNGLEVAYPIRINLFEKFTIDYAANPELQNWFSHVLQYYHQSEVLKNGALNQFYTADNTAIIFERKLLGKESVWIIVNPNNNELKIKLPPALQDRNLLDVLSNVGMKTAEEVNLMPFQYHVVVIK